MVRNVLVTGGTSGIGLGIIKRLATGGKWRVVSMSRDEQHADAARATLGHDGENVQFVVGDVSQEASCRAVVSRIEKDYGSLHGLVNSAGTICAGGIEDGTVEDWNRVLDVNLTGTYLVTRSMVPLLKKESHASVVNVSSVCSLRPCGSVAYSVSKAGVDMLTKCMAKELAVYGIRVNAINPSVVRSKLQTSAGIVDDYESFLAQMAPLHPLGRNGVPEDLAPIVELLLSENSTWITGACISVDGGRAL